MVAFLNEVTLHWDQQPEPLTLNQVVVDTGLEFALLIPSGLMIDQSYPGYHKMNRPIRGINGGALSCDVFLGTVVLAGEEHQVEVYVAKDAPDIIIGLEILKKFHLMLAEGDAGVPWGPCLLRPPLSQHGFTRAG
ncbi:hypothetical protein L6R49_01520 [Myxococcota bacterium]|nr:hypothetical protein [Myxococcota bacterium]